MAFVPDAYPIKGNGCHGCSMRPSAASASASTAPPAATTRRGPHRSTRHPTTGFQAPLTSVKTEKAPASTERPFPTRLTAQFCAQRIVMEAASIAEARDWVKQINRPNLLVKIPATPEGLPAIRRLIGEGISVNVTLTFSLERYREVIDAYLSGLEDFNDVGGDISSVRSVASFFVSRFDTEVDRRLDDLGTPDALELKGKTAVANARVAYGVFEKEFASTRFGTLAARGARHQRPLWASTSTKNPDYPDLLYVEQLVAANTVNTMPLATIDAYQDHGDPNPTRFTQSDIEQATADLDRLGDLGVSYDDVVATLEREGVEKFAASWVELLEGVEQA